MIDPVTGFVVGYFIKSYRDNRRRERNEWQQPRFQQYGPPPQQFHRGPRFYREPPQRFLPPPPQRSNRRSRQRYYSPPPQRFPRRTAQRFIEPPRSNRRSRQRFSPPSQQFHIHTAQRESFPEENKRTVEAEKRVEELVKEVAGLKERVNNFEAGNPKANDLREKLEKQRKNSEPQWQMGPDGKRRMPVSSVGKKEQPQHRRNYGKRGMASEAKKD